MLGDDRCPPTFTHMTILRPGHASLFQNNIVYFTHYKHFLVAINSFLNIAFALGMDRGNMIQGKKCTS